MSRLAITAALILGGALLSPGLAPAAHAHDALPASFAEKLDRRPAAYAMTDAKRRRLMIMHETARQQRYHERRRGYGHGGYVRPHRAPPPYGYGRRHDRW